MLCTGNWFGRLVNIGSRVCWSAKWKSLAVPPRTALFSSSTTLETSPEVSLVPPLDDELLLLPPLLPALLLLPPEFLLPPQAARIAAAPTAPDVAIARR